jgi:serine/threonine protein kinase
MGRGAFEWPQMIAETPQPIASGTALGRYVVRSRLAGDIVRRQRLEREASAVATLNHPHIVTLHSIEEDGDVLFLTMELVDGATLTDAIPAEGLPLDRFLSLAIQLADALQAAHARGVIHRERRARGIAGAGVRHNRSPSRVGRIGRR